MRQLSPKNISLATPSIPPICLQDIGVMPPMHVIGCLQMDTKPLKYSLKSEAASWKAQVRARVLVVHCLYGYFKKGR